MEKNVKFRNHFFMVIENLLSMWVLWIYLIIAVLSEGSLDGMMKPVLVVGGITLFVFILNFIGWRRTTYVFDENAIVMEKSTLTKTTVTISMSNISTVNINRSVIQAILGIRKVKIDTNSSSSTNSEVEIYLSKRDAYAFQQTIMNYIEGNNAKTAKIGKNSDKINEVSNEEVKEKNNEKHKVKGSTQASLDEIILHCIYTLRIVEVIITAVSGGFLVLSEATMEEGDSVSGAMSAITVVIMVAGLVISFLKSFFAYYKLEAVRINNEINISYGFFDKKTFRMPVNRVVAIKIKEPLIGRFFKKAYAEIVCVGMGDEEKELSLISLCTSKKLLAEKLYSLLPEFIPEEVKNAEEFYTIKREDKKAILVRLLKSMIYMISLVIGAFIGIGFFGDAWTEIFGIFGLIILGLCILILIYGICKNKTSGYAVDSKYFRIANGAFNREIYFIPYKKIEHMTINKSPVYKLFELATANVNTRSGGFVGEIIQTCYINDKDIRLIRDKYRESYKRR